MKSVVLSLLMANSALAATVEVRMTFNNRFDPPNTNINVGDTVTWICSGGFHDTVSGSGGVPSGVWDSNTQYPPPIRMRPGDRFSFTFNTVGNYPYYCTPHWSFFGMVGTIRVIAPNSPPSVSITTPPDGATFSAPADITVEANAVDDGTVRQVEFFMNGSPIGAFATPPYRLTATNLGPGNYTFSSVATDDANATGSASVSVTVTNPPSGTAPTITIHPESQTVTSGTNVTFTAGAVGSSPLFWQWLFNGSPIPGATDPSLELTNVEPANAGVYFVTVSNAFGSATSSNATLTVILPPPFLAKNDFNHDGQTDFLWQHGDGRVRLWLMDGVNRIDTLLLRNGRPAAPGSRIVGTHDFDLDGNVDILWQRGDGTLQLWFMNGVNFLRGEIIPGPALGRAWQVVGLGDFDRDLHADILLRHTEGYLLLWHMKGKRFVRQQLLYNGKAIPPLWRVAGVADINNDGYSDILWQKPSSAIVIWFMPVTPHTSSPLLSHLPRLSAQIVGLNDLDQDGKLDFIWRYPDGHLSAWRMNQTNHLASFPINQGEPVPPAWKFAAPRN